VFIFNECPAACNLEQNTGKISSLVHGLLHGQNRPIYTAEYRVWKVVTYRQGSAYLYFNHPRGPFLEVLAVAKGEAAGGQRRCQAATSTQRVKIGY
jgi:hypothetical protein